MLGGSELFFIRLVLSFLFCAAHVDHTAPTFADLINYAIAMLQSLKSSAHNAEKDEEEREAK